MCEDKISRIAALLGELKVDCRFQVFQQLMQFDLGNQLFHPLPPLLVLPQVPGPFPASTLYDQLHLLFRRSF